MKIAMINNLYTPNIMGGGELSVQYLAEAVKKNGHDVVVLTLSPRSKTEVEVVNGVRVYYIGLKNIFWLFTQNNRSSAMKILWHLIDTHNPFMRREVVRILEAEKPDIAHTNNVRGFSVDIWREINKMNIPLVHTLRDYYLLCFRGTMYRSTGNCAGQCRSCQILTSQKRQQTSKVDIVVGISQFILNRHLHYGYFPHSSPTVIRNIFEKQGGPHHGNRNANQRIFGFIGRLIPTKGIELLVEAFRSADIASNSRLLIAGDGPPEYVRKLKSYCHDLPIEFLGFTDALEFYNKVDMVVLPSLWEEPLSRVIFEAFACGKPVLGSNRGGIAEILKNGETGYLFDAKSQENLADSLRKIADISPDELGRLSQNCLKMSEEFLPDLIAAQYVSIYNEAISV